MVNKNVTEIPLKSHHVILINVALSSSPERLEHFQEMGQK